MPRLAGSTAFARKVGARIRAIRLDANLTQEALALAANLNGGFLSQIESGQRLPSLTALLAVAAPLGVTPSDLLSFDLSNPRMRLLDAARREDREGVLEALKALDLR